MASFFVTAWDVPLISQASVKINIDLGRGKFVFGHLWLLPFILFCFWLLCLFPFRLLCFFPFGPFCFWLLCLFPFGPFRLFSLWLLCLFPFRLSCLFHFRLFRFWLSSLFLLFAPLYFSQEECINCCSAWTNSIKLSIINKCKLFLWQTKYSTLCRQVPMDNDKRVLPPIPFVYLRRHMCCRAIK